jgi:histone H3/H4
VGKIIKAVVSEQLAEAAKEAYSKSAREVIENIEKAVSDWTDGKGANDDVTFFVIKALK